MKKSGGDSRNIVSIKIGGQAGQGVKTVGLMLAKLAVRSGYNIYDHIEFPSLIRGGHNVMQVNISIKEVGAPQKKSDILIALNQDTLNRHLTEINRGGGIIFNTESKIDTSKVDKKTALYGLPLSTIAREARGEELQVNIGAIGAVVGLLGGDLGILRKLIDEEFVDKGEEISSCNRQAAEQGLEFAQKNFSIDPRLKDKLKPIATLNSSIPSMVVTGAEAAALGAIAAGIQFAPIYPMSPTSNILHTLATNAEKFGYVVKQVEDEISAINMAVGAGFAGARTLTTTSGGGFCLMTEAYGLAGMTETPVVIVEGMRTGPATGLPTWSEQGDLQFILHAHQSEFPRIVLAAGDAKEAFDLTMQAFNLADKYQTPVVLILDKNICENDQSYPLFDTSAYKVDRGQVVTKAFGDFQRYKYEPNGISPRAFPGSGNFLIANADEHDQLGYSTEDIDIRNKMMEKRMQKLITCAKEDMADPQIFGPENADITIVSWGSNKGSILQALEQFDNVNYLHIIWMSPFPAESVKKVLFHAKHIIDVEANYTGQLANLITEKTGIEIKDRLLKYDGRQIFPEEIVEKIKEAK